MIVKEKKITQAELRRVLCYNPLSGNWMWKIPLALQIEVGSIAGTIIRDRRGRSYRCIRINGYGYLAHRLAFLYMKGRWPQNQIDHKDGNGLNNSWLNLRGCSNSQNLANRGPNNNNKLGIKGVHRRTNGKYYAQIGYNSKKVYLGSFDTLEIAACAYRKAAEKYFGQFAAT